MKLPSVRELDSKGAFQVEIDDLTNKNSERQVYVADSTA